MTLLLRPFSACDYAAWRERQVDRCLRWLFGSPSADSHGVANARLVVDELAPADGLSGTYLESVMSDTEIVGWLWLSREDDALVVLDAQVEAPACDLLRLLTCRARTADARALVLDLMVGAPTMVALAEAGDFAASHLSMLTRLDFDTAECETAAPSLRLELPKIPVAGPR